MQWCRISSGDTMKQHVSIARALKEKSRIAGRIHTLTDVINHENGIRVNYDLRLEKLNPQD